MSGLCSFASGSSSVTAQARAIAKVAKVGRVGVKEGAPDHAIAHS
jgi:hypothetical protein